MVETQHPVTIFIFVMANFTITLGYLWLALAVLPHVPITLIRTKIGGVGFFLLCGMTHLDMAFGALLHPGKSLGQMAVTWHALAIHVPQAICVWLFVTGLYVEIVRWGFVPNCSRSDRDT